MRFCKALGFAYPLGQKSEELIPTGLLLLHLAYQCVFLLIKHMHCNFPPLLLRYFPKYFGCFVTSVQGLAWRLSAPRSPTMHYWTLLLTGWHEVVRLEHQELILSTC